MVEETTLEETKEILNPIMTEVNLPLVFLIMKIFKEKYRIEITIMLQSS